MSEALSAVGTAEIASAGSLPGVVILKINGEDEDSLIAAGCCDGAADLPKLTTFPKVALLLTDAAACEYPRAARRSETAVLLLV